MAARFSLLLMSTLCLLSASYFATEAWLLNSGKAENIRRATRWMPWSVEAWRLMPQVEPARAALHWRHVLQLAPQDTEARLALATDAELAGRAHEAEALLLEAARYNKGYLPAWTLANFYLRQNKEAEFWHWARRAATFEVDLTALFQLALGLRPDPPALLKEFALERAPVRQAALVQLLNASSQQDLLEEALPVARLIARSPSTATKDQLLWDADALLKKSSIAPALAYWNLAGAYPSQQPPTLFNGDFTHISLERGFDWRPGSAEVSLNMGRGLHIGLYGKEEDTAVLLLQTLVLEPGRSYELQYRYRTNLPADAHPVRWQLGDLRSPPLEPGDWHDATWHFQAPLDDAPADAANLKLVSRYESGTRRAQGEIEITNVTIPRTNPESAAYSHQ